MIALQTPHFIVHSDGAGFVIRLQRTSVDYPDVSTMDRDFDAVSAMLDRLGRDRKALLIDWREGPLRNDAPFEEALRRTMPKIIRNYRSVAVLVRSAVGALQVKRHFREANLLGEVFQDEADAMDFLRGGGGAMSRRPTPIPGGDRSAMTNSRERMSTAQIQAVERAPATVGRGDRPSSLPPMPMDRSATSRDRSSSVPPQAGERISQLPSYEDRASTLPPPPPLPKPPRT